MTAPTRFTLMGFQASSKAASSISSRTTLLPIRLSATTPRYITSTTQKPADVAPIVGTGPPPEPPAPTSNLADTSAQRGSAVDGPRNAESAAVRVARRRRQAEMLKEAKQIRKNAAGQDNKSGLTKRFWKTVAVREVDGAYQIFLDSRPLRHPATKEIVHVPLSKPNLASAIAIEWDLLVSAQQATKQHLIPLTSLICRAHDIADDDRALGDGSAQAAAANPDSIRAQITTTVLRYLDTDSLLCWSPHPADEAEAIRNKETGETLREAQERVANDISGYMSAHVWPGVTIEPVLDDESIMPKQQSKEVRTIVQGWVSTLAPFELAALERAVLAGKSLVAASRLVVEWSEHEPAGSSRPVTEPPSGVKDRFGVEEMAKATSLEVDWQTDRWGEVEDSHDVQKEDLRRQLGSAVLLVSGLGKR